MTLLISTPLRSALPATTKLATPAKPFVRIGFFVAGVFAASASFLSVCLAALCFNALLCFNAFAADASPWNEDSHSAMRLVAGDRPLGGALRAGIEVRLAGGWKTYWRYPGDSGVPPEFDFSKSENVRSVSILWPAPHRLTYDGGASIGYKGDVMFPVHVVPDDPARPTTLRLTIAYAVCEKLCVPAHGEAGLVLAPAPAASAQEQRLAAAEAQTPKPAGLGDTTGGAAPLGVAAVRLESAQPHPRVVVDVIAPDAAPLDLFAEGPAADWALPLPEPAPGAPPGQRRFAFDLDGMPPGVEGTGVPLRLTLVSGENAVEVTAVPK
jgi:DsbC/DsbD-like thiol-disulfide interchange protein